MERSTQLRHTLSPAAYNAPLTAMEPTNRIGRRAGGLVGFGRVKRPDTGGNNSRDVLDDIENRPANRCDPAVDSKDAHGPHTMRTRIDAGELSYHYTLGKSVGKPRQGGFHNHRRITAGRAIGRRDSSCVFIVACGVRFLSRSSGQSLHAASISVRSQIFVEKRLAHRSFASRHASLHGLLGPAPVMSNTGLKIHGFHRWFGLGREARSFYRNAIAALPHPEYAAPRPSALALRALRGFGALLSKRDKHPLPIPKSLQALIEGLGPDI